jgi:hypothetical protein
MVGGVDPGEWSWNVMALKALLESLDGLPEAVAAEYTKREDGKFVLNVEKVADGDNGELELAPVSKLKSALEAERTNVRNANAKLAAFKDLDPVKAKEALGKVAEMQTWKPETEVENRIKLLKEELATANKTEKEALQKRISRAEAQLKKTLVTNVAVAAIQKAKGSVTLLLPHVERSIRMREQDSEDQPYLVEVVNEKGDVAVGDGAGNPMTIDQLVAKFQASDEFAPAFAPSGASGSGASNGRQQQKGSVNTTVKVGRVITGVDPADVTSGKVTLQGE